ncbi:MAG: hypothetical protein H6537_02400 [Bacteroidales bacterium]|nr:hypothetical protein [Bacteroidales bacterium]HRX30859.1 hypothetical protein [Tenuifilaceae bacterium]
MKQIKLTQKEVDDLIDLYQTEIDRAQRRIESLQSILKKVEMPQNEVASQEMGNKPAPKKRGRKPKVRIETDAVEVKKEPKKRGRKPKVKTELAVPKKRGRKPKSSSLRKPIKKGKGEDKVKWIDLINEVLGSKKSFMLANSITLAAMEKLGIDESDKDRVRMAISTNLTRLTKYDKSVVKYHQPGQKGSFYGLPGWFNEDGSVKSEFEGKLM